MEGGAQFRATGRKWYNEPLNINNQQDRYIGQAKKQTMQHLKLCGNMNITKVKQMHMNTHGSKWLIYCNFNIHWQQQLGFDSRHPAKY